MMQWFFEPHWSSPWTWYLTPGPETGRVLTKISENKRADGVPHALSPSPHPNCYWWKCTGYACYTLYFYPKPNRDVNFPDSVRLHPNRVEHGVHVHIPKLVPFR